MSAMQKLKDVALDFLDALLGVDERARDAWGKGYGAGHESGYERGFDEGVRSAVEEVMSPPNLEPDEQARLEASGLHQNWRSQ